MNWIYHCARCGWKFIIVTDYTDNEARFSCPHCRSTKVKPVAIQDGHHRLAVMVRVLRNMAKGNQ